MNFPRFILAGVAIACLAPEWAAAAERKSCLTPEERRAVIAARKAVPLGRAMRLAQARIGGEVLKARLCRQDRGLVYVLTVLARNGRVMQARIDAADGHWIGGS